jgi:lysophospholipase L1-like esterase
MAAASLAKLSDHPAGIPDATAVPNWSAARAALVLTAGPKFAAGRCLYNADSPYIAMARLAYARALAGGAPLHWINWGDSTTHSPHSGGAVVAGSVTKCATGRMQAIAQSTARFGAAREGLAHVYAEQYPSAGSPSDSQSRFTFGSGWSYGSSLFSGASANPATTSGTLDFAASGSVDSFTIYYLTTSTATNLTLQVDAGGTSTVSIQNASPLLIKSTTVTATVGAGHVLHIGVSGAPANVFVLAVEAYNSTAPTVLKFSRAGQPGAQAGSVIGGFSTHAPFSATSGYAPDVAVFDFGYNESAQSASPETCYDYLKSGAEQALAGNCLPILSVQPHPVVSAGTFGGWGAWDVTTWGRYTNLLYSLADKLNIPLFDRNRRWRGGIGTFGGFRDDAVHPSVAGHCEWGSTLYGIMTDIL